MRRVVLRRLLTSVVQESPLERRNRRQSSASCISKPASSIKHIVRNAMVTSPLSAE